MADLNLPTPEEYARAHPEYTPPVFVPFRNWSRETLDKFAHEVWEQNCMLRHMLKNK